MICVIVWTFTECTICDFSQQSQQKQPIHSCTAYCRGFFFYLKTHRHPNLYVYDMPCQLELPQLVNNRLVERKLVANGFIFQTKISLLVTASEMYGFADFLSVIIVNEDSLGF